MISIKIIVFKIIDTLVIKDIKKSNLSNLEFFIFIAMYIILEQFNNSLYNYTNLQNYKDLQIYFNILRITFVNNIKIGIF